jgi:hypothetical protein
VEHVSIASQYERAKSFLSREGRQVADTVFAETDGKVQDFIRRYERPYTLHREVMGKKKMLGFQRLSGSSFMQMQPAKNRSVEEVVSTISKAFLLKAEDHDTSMAEEMEDSLASYGERRSIFSSMRSRTFASMHCAPFQKRCRMLYAESRTKTLTGTSPCQMPLRVGTSLCKKK